MSASNTEGERTEKAEEVTEDTKLNDRGSGKDADKKTKDAKDDAPGETGKKSGLKEKLKRLEEKYVETLKQQSALKDNLEKSSEALKGILTELGSKQIAESLDENLDALKVAVENLKKQHKEEVDKIKQERFEADNKSVELQAMVNRLQTNNSDLLTVLKHKETDIVELKRINESLKKDSSDPILQRFNSLNSPGTQQRSNEEKDEEISRLKYELDQVYNQLDEAEEQLAASAKKSPTNKKDAQIQVSWTEPVKTKPSIESTRARPEVEREAEEEVQSKIYLKNLIIRYMVYEAKRNDAECSVIRRAILDCVGIAGEDRAVIDEAVNNRGGIKDAVYFLKSFGGMS